MTDSLPPLPKFAKPPIAEVALSVQFEPLGALRAAHLGLLWERLRERFPKTQEHAPIDRVVEEFGVRPSSGIGIQLELLDKPPIPRCWFLNQAETELVQVQQDRLVVNWRRGDDQEYPHFESVRKLFEYAYDEFTGFARAERLGEVLPDQCELIYIDHITGANVWEHYHQLDRVLAIVSSPAGEDLPLEPENVRLAINYIIPDERGGPMGRLHVDVQPGYRRGDDVPILVMTTTARGKPVSDGREGVLAFFDIGHDRAVRAFVALTSPQMQSAWEKYGG